MYLMTSLRYKFKASRYSALLVRCLFPWSYCHRLQELPVVAGRHA